ncbi:Prolyl tripeptidyl peptidase precursor [Novipirellula aureliae]|uniref:Prolyl tripeptidyl peptidase n=1 Tax=Novipirellula aureliae TaxID=2527966 RepID=A0A5C6E4D5_9BACT|nr:prolyl oligopeptidase family serine peptidase [Novipirellula aureliae]TWU43768.1 Prolyl tripeptidyl peptidase precursor [Novipirellula aureliae]
MTRLLFRFTGQSRISKIAAVLVFLTFCPAVVAQDITRRMLEHSDYDVWNTLSNAKISNDGNWVLYAVQSGAIDGESTLHIQHVDTAREYVIERAAQARFTFNSQFAVFLVTPEKKILKQFRKQKKESQERPQAKMQALELASGDIITLDDARSFGLPQENGDWVACQMEKPTVTSPIDKTEKGPREVYEVTGEGLRQPAKQLKLKSRGATTRKPGRSKPDPVEESEAKAKQKPQHSEPPRADQDDKDPKKKTVGTPLKLVNLPTEIQRTFPFVRAFRFSKKGNWLAFVTSVEAPDKEERNGEQADDLVANEVVDGVHLLQLDSLKLTCIARGVGEYKNLAFNEDGSRLAFITNKDDYESKSPKWSVYEWTAGSKQAKCIAGEGEQGIPSGWWIAPGSTQRYSEDGRRLYFETSPIPEAILKQRRDLAEGRDVDAEESEERAKLDLWHWQDPQLQPQQLLEAEAERKRDYRAAYVLKSKKIVQIEDLQTPVVDIDYRSPSNVSIANSNVPYRKMLSWDVPGYQDVYLVNLNSGRRTQVLNKVRSDAALSPTGKYIVWFDAEQKKWFAKKAKDKDAKSIEISKGIKHPLYNVLDDRPMLPSAYGTAGWLRGDRALLIYDRYDIWKLDPTGESKPVCITLGSGRRNEIRFRYRHFDSKQRFVDAEKPMLLTAFHLKTKASGFYSLPALEGNAKNKQAAPVGPAPLIMLDENLGELQKAKDSDQVVFTRSTFRMFPDLWTSTTRFEKISRVSDLNPQQDEYSWGTSELTHWESRDGQTLDGILLKPDGFDPSKKYPLLVYFYERSSDGLHKYYPPAAGRSIICFSFYVSRGYVVFIPDIPYKTGEPGQSAANAVLPGVEHLIAKGFVDQERIGMQGHSWGGYQTAYLVTQTDMFACAEAGAPVSNMTSAYGGIRWSSGMSRMFQYERTQSRIGGDLWAAREKYIANSPLFFADNIDTPLLILHNDQDGAVPWYQGIELFVALRRLEKPAWMLNYNGDPHWVMGDYNRRDFAIRMQQFFDHYLKDAPEPVWMAEGIPAVEKGKDLGLELLEPK